MTDELTAEEEEIAAWLMNVAIPKRTREEVVKYLLAARTKLWDDLNRENFTTTRWDYGYGGESVESPETDHEALYEWIVERERSILGMTLEEFAKQDWRLD